MFGRVPSDYKFKALLTEGIARRSPKIFTGYTQAGANEEGRFLLTYLVKKAFCLKDKEEGYESCSHYDMVRSLEKNGKKEVVEATNEIKNLYTYVQEKIEINSIRLKRVIPKRERYDEIQGELFHYPNILSSYTSEHSTGEYGDEHDRILTRNVNKKEILIHPLFVERFNDAEYEFIIINKFLNLEYIEYKKDNDCKLEYK